MARRKQTVLDDLMAIAGKLPWWIGVLLAIASYALLHWAAGMQVAPPKDMHDLGANVVWQIVKVLALFGQYLVPLALLLGAGGVCAASSERANDSATTVRFVR